MVLILIIKFANVFLISIISIIMHSVWLELQISQNKRLCNKKRATLVYKVVFNPFDNAIGNKICSIQIKIFFKIIG